MGVLRIDDMDSDLSDDFVDLVSKWKGSDAFNVAFRMFLRAGAFAFVFGLSFDIDRVSRSFSEPAGNLKGVPFALSLSLIGVCSIVPQVINGVP
jgi:hypothetical protein